MSVLYAVQVLEFHPGASYWHFGCHHLTYEQCDLFICQMSRNTVQFIQFLINIFDCFVGSNNKAWRTHRSHPRGPDHERRGSRQKWSVLPLFLSYVGSTVCKHFCLLKPLHASLQCGVKCESDLYYNKIMFRLQWRNVFRNYLCTWIHQFCAINCPFEWQVYWEALLLAHMFSFSFVFIVSSLFFSPATVKPKENFHMCRQ